MSTLRASLAQAFDDRDPDELLAAVAKGITNALVQGKPFAIPGVGELAVQQRPARQGRDMRTGEPMMVPATVAIPFTAVRDFDAAPNVPTPQASTLSFLQAALDSDPSAARQVLDTVATAMRELLLAGDTVSIPAVGTFSPDHKPGRIARNPQTGERTEVAAKTTVEFANDDALEDRVREGHGLDALVRPSAEEQTLIARMEELQRGHEWEAFNAAGSELFSLRRPALEPVDRLGFYLGTVVEHRFLLPAGKIEEARERIVAQDPSVADCETLQACCKKRFSDVELDQHGNVVDIHQAGDIWLEDWLAVIADLVEPASYFVILDDTYDFWKMTFEGGGLNLLHEVRAAG